MPISTRNKQSMRDIDSAFSPAKIRTLSATSRSREFSRQSIHEASEKNLYLLAALQNYYRAEKESEYMLEFESRKRSK